MNTADLKAMHIGQTVVAKVDGALYRLEAVDGDKFTFVKCKVLESTPDVKVIVERDRAFKAFRHFYRSEAPTE